MADFCVQCADDMGFEDTDLAGITTMEDWAQDLAAVVICEGCGVIQVDPHGNCVSADCVEKGHKGARRKMVMCQCGHDDIYHYISGHAELGGCAKCICEKFHKANPPPDDDSPTFTYDPPAVTTGEPDSSPAPDSAPDSIDPGGGDSGGGGSSETF